MKKYTKTSKNILFLFKDLIIDFCLMMVIILFLFYNIGDDWNLFIFLFLLIFVFYIFIFVIPVLYLYVNYTRYNNIELTFDENKIYYNKNIILLSEIKTINIIGTYQLFNKNDSGIGTLPYSPYFYYIEIVADKTYILTSLLSFSLSDDFQEFYPHLEYKKNIKSYPIIKNDYF